MRVVVVGATGNVGSAVVGALLGDPLVEQVVAVARRRAAYDAPKLQWHRADISRDPLGPVVEGADAVIHLAWRLQPQHRRGVQEATNLVGTARLVDAVIEQRVPALIAASSVGTYAAGPKDVAVDESWPATGIPSSTYSRHKARVEALLRDREAAAPWLRVVRMRTSLVFQRAAAAEISRIFVGPWLPRRVPGPLRIVPRVAQLRVQATHAADVAEAYRLAVHSDAAGAFNIAAPGVLDAELVAGLVGGRTVPVPAAVARSAMHAGFLLRLQRSEPGWLDLARRTPLMDSGRARRVLGWHAQRSATEAFEDLLRGLGEGAGGPTLPLHPKPGGRLVELAP